MDGLVREIKQYKRDNNEEFVIESMNSRVKKLVEVPCVSASSFYKKGKEWLDDLLQSCTTSNDTSVGVKCMVEYLLKRHKTAAEKALQENARMPKVMNEYEVIATMDKAQIGYSIWRSIVQCLKQYMGLKTICVPEARCTRVLGKDHTKIKTGVYEYCKEEGERIELCEWFAIDAFDELKRHNE
jgi:hypothetical protein